MATLTNFQLEGIEMYLGQPNRVLLDEWARGQAVAELRAANRQVAVLDQQAAWTARAAGPCWPAMPAWTD